MRNFYGIDKFSEDCKSPTHLQPLRDGKILVYLGNFSNMSKFDCIYIFSMISKPTEICNFLKMDKIHEI